MRALALLLMLAVTPADQRLREPFRFERMGDRTSSWTPHAASAASYAFFEFAPASGAGMGTACAGTTPTGAKGELLTFSRASTRYCTKANETSGIANGDLVLLTSGQPAVMPGGAGTGALGLGVWEARTNLALRSDQFADAAWANFIAGAGTNPTKGSADTDVAPDGTTTAEEVTFNATGASDSSGIQQTIFSAAVESGSIYAKGNATTGSGSFDLCIDTAGAQTCVAVPFVLATWTRTCLPNVTSKASGKFYIGNLSSLNGGTTRPGQTPTIWMGQGEAGATCSPPIITAGTAATRVAEVADVAITFGGGTAGMAMAATSTSSAAQLGAGNPATFFIGDRLPGVAAGSTSYVGLEIKSPGTLLSVECTNPPCSGSTYNGSVLVSASAVDRLVVTHSGVLLNTCINGVCNTGRADTYAAPTFTRIRLGSYNSSVQVINSVVKLVCADTYASGNCRL